MNGSDPGNTTEGGRSTGVPAPGVRRAAHAGAALLVALALTGQFEGLLRANHLDRRPAGGLDAITPAPLRAHGPDHRGAVAVVRAWREFADRVPDRVRPITTARAVAGWSLAVEALVVVPLVAVVLVLLLRRARAAARAAERPGADSTRGTPPEPGWRAVTAVAAHRRMPWLVATAVVAALVEAGASWLFVTRVWAQAAPGPRFAGRVPASTYVPFALAYGAAMVKWVALAGVVLPLAALAVRAARPLAGAVVRAAWLPLVLLGVLVVAVSSDQGLDAIRRWEPLQAACTLLALVLAAVMLSVSGGRVLAGAVTARAAHSAHRPGSTTSRPALGAAARRLWPLAGAALVCLVLGVTAAPGFLIPFAALTLTLLLSAPIEHWWSDADLEAPRRPEVVPAVSRVAAAIGAATFLIVGRAAVSAAAGDLFYPARDQLTDAVSSGQTVLLLFGIVLALATVPGYTALSQLAAAWNGTRSRPFRAFAVGATGVPVAVITGLLAVPATSEVVSPWFGAVGVILVFAAAACTADIVVRVAAELGTITPWTRRWANPALLRALRFDRPPIVGGVVAWALVAGIVDPAGYHDVRLLATPAPAPVSVADAFQAWRRRLPPIPPGLKEPNDPLVVVAASGGGIRAAYWTSSVLTCMIERDERGGDPCGKPATAEEVSRRRARLFAMSGVSGSSLGLVAYERHAASGEPSELDGRPWYERRLGADFLAPTLARMLFMDAPNLLARATVRGVDRAAALEQSWERAWGTAGTAGVTLGGAQGFFAAQQSATGPLLLLNGYAAEDGCRVLISAIETTGDRDADSCGRLEDVPVQAVPGSAEAPVARPASALPTLDATTDAHDLSCRDLRWSTAALLSARFPYITPSGRLTCPDRSGAPRSYVVDGGYRDASGASTIVELWPTILDALDRTNNELALRGGCIVPFFLQIDNEYAAVDLHAPDGRPSEVLLPAQAVYRTKDGNAKAARAAAQRIFSGPIDRDGTVVSFRYDPQTQLGTVGPRWLRIYPHSHPGSGAPLGWVLSKAARADLDAQLRANRAAIDKGRQWLNADQDSLRCTRGATDTADATGASTVAADSAPIVPGPTRSDDGELLTVP